MADEFATGALLGHVFELGDGTRVRLRLARASDTAAITDLLQREGGHRRHLSAARLVRFDPRHEYVVCAVSLIDGRERLLGIGAIKLDGAATAPHMLVVGSAAGHELRRLLTKALMGCASARLRSRAA